MARLDAGQTVTVPAAPLVHVFVARGALLRSSLAEPLHDGDAFLLTDEPAHELTAGVPTELLCGRSSERSDRQRASERRSWRLRSNHHEMR